MSYTHAPVMEREAVRALAPADGGLYVDATFGGGGYARAMLSAADCRVVGFDRDPSAIARAADWVGVYGARLSLINRPFAEMEEALAGAGVDAIDGAAFDLGVSSTQLDEPARGFSFRAEGPLSMRMDGDRPDASDVVNRGDVDDLAAIFKVYGEERDARKIARSIARARETQPIRTTLKLAEIVAAVAPRREDRIHPATRVFQALRIFVNDELGQLARGLVAAERLLRPAGRLVVVTFHSLEDRIVKRFFADRSGGQGGPSRHAPARAHLAPTLRPLFAKPQTPDAAEVEANPRARSAKLRAAVRLDTPARAADVFEFAPAPIALSKALAEWRRP